MVIANINYLCIVYILFCIGLIIFLKPGLEPRLWAFSCCKPSPSPIQAHQWAGLGRAQMGWAWVGFGPGPAHHYTCISDSIIVGSVDSVHQHLDMGDHYTG